MIKNLTILVLAVALAAATHLMFEWRKVSIDSLRAAKEWEALYRDMVSLNDSLMSTAIRELKDAK